MPHQQGSPASNHPYEHSSKGTHLAGKMMHKKTKGSKWGGGGLHINNTGLGTRDIFIDLLYPMTFQP